MATGGYVRWFPERVRRFTHTAPAQAFRQAAFIAAGASARAVRGRGTGALARDVSRPHFVALMTAYVGSGLPYARLQHFGGTVRPRQAERLLIRGQRVGAAGQRTRSTHGGRIVASADEVTIPAKRYLDDAVRVFPATFISMLRRLL